MAVSDEPATRQWPLYKGALNLDVDPLAGHLDPLVVGADADISGVSEAAEGMDGHGVPESSVSSGHHGDMVVGGHEGQGGLRLSLGGPLPVVNQAGVINRADRSIRDHSDIVGPSISESASDVRSGSDLTHGVRLGLGFSFPLFINIGHIASVGGTPSS